MSIDYISNLIKTDKLCDDFVNSVIHVYFDEGKLLTSKVYNFCDTKAYHFE